MNGTKKTAALLMASSMLLLAACGNDNNAGSESGASPSGSAASGEKKPVTLKVLVASDWLKEKKWQTVFDDYEAATGNKLDIQSAPVNNYMDLVNTRLATQDAPDLLFYWGQEAKIKQLQPEKNLVDLTNEEFASRINPAVSKYFLKSEGKLYGIPVTGLSVGGVLYNKKVFADLGIQIPQTYDELLAASEKIKAAGITPIYEAGKEGWPLQIFTFNAMANVLQAQPDLMDKLNTRQTTYDQVPEYVDALQRQADLRKSGYLNKDLFSGTYDMSLEQLATGKAAMVIQADWAVSPLLEKFPDAEIGMFPMPWNGDNLAAISDPNGLYVLKNSKNADAAMDFVRFFSEQEQLTKYFNSVKSIPTWTGLAVDLNPGTADMNSFVESGKAVPFFNSLSVVEIGDYQSLLQQLYGGQMSAKEVAAGLQSNVDKGAKAAGIAGF
jgi:ABC-type sugar transport system, periplasmic component